MIPVFFKDIYNPIRIWIENNYFNFDSTDDISEITDSIYIGNFSTSTNKKLLKEKGITHILSCISHFNPLHTDDFTYKHIKAYDKLNFDLSVFFDESNEFIRKGTTNNNKIFVHCMFGTSRSVALVIAFLIKNNNKDLDYLLQEIKTKRKTANPNDSFKKQLRLYSTIL